MIGRLFTPHPLLRRLIADREGATIIEFALVAPVLFHAPHATKPAASGPGPACKVAMGPPWERCDKSLTPLSSNPFTRVK